MWENANFHHRQKTTQLFWLKGGFNFKAFCVLAQQCILRFEGSTQRRLTYWNFLTIRILGRPSLPRQDYIRSWKGGDKTALRNPGNVFDSLSSLQLNDTCNDSHHGDTRTVSCSMTNSGEQVLSYCCPRVQKCTSILCVKVGRLSLRKVGRRGCFVKQFSTFFFLFPSLSPASGCE